MKPINVLDVSAHWGFPVWDLFDRFPEKYKLCTDINHADLLAFGGGTDINPMLYDARNVADIRPHLVRDMIEVDTYNDAYNSRIPMIGICRGAQLLNCLEGGWLMQDVNNHCGDHALNVNYDNKVYQIKCNSTHHQMMMPAVRGRIIGWAEERTRATYDKDCIRVSCIREYDPEIIYYDNNPHVLCVQGHPEYYNDQTHPLPALVHRLISELLIQ